MPTRWSPGRRRRGARGAAGKWGWVGADCELAVGRRRGFSPPLVPLHASSQDPGLPRSLHPGTLQPLLRRAIGIFLLPGSSLPWELTTRSRGSHRTAIDVDIGLPPCSNWRGINSGGEIELVAAGIQGGAMGGPTPGPGRCGERRGEIVVGIGCGEREGSARLVVGQRWSLTGQSRC
jgi:hypothetical protein